MEFALSEDQVLLKDSLNGFLQDKASLDTIRAIAAGDVEVAAKLDAGLNEMGLSSLIVPEDRGGLGLGLLDACLVQETLGYALAPSRFLANTVTCRALATSESDILENFVAGDVQFGLALQGFVSRRDGATIAEDESGLSGTAFFAVSVPRATHLCVAADDGIAHITEACLNAPHTTIDRTRVFSKLSLSQTSSLAHIDDPQSLLATARLLIAADTLGAAQAMLDKAVAYAAERKQFDRVIGSFQAVKHMCAEMAAKLEPCRAFIWHAAHAMDTGDEEGLVMATLAKAHLSEVGAFVAKTATEVHGGMGFTDLLGLHYWFKRIGVNRQLFGGPEQVREVRRPVTGTGARLALSGEFTGRTYGRWSTTFWRFLKPGVGGRIENVVHPVQEDLTAFLVAQAIWVSQPEI